MEGYEASEATGKLAEASEVSSLYPEQEGFAVNTISLVTCASGILVR